MQLDVVTDALLYAAVFIMVYKLWKKIRKHFVRPVVYVVEDNEHDIMLLKIHTGLEKYDVRYFRELDGLAFQMAIRKPDAVLVDYYLPNSQTGDKLFKFCKRNNIEPLMITAYDGPIKDIDQKYIVKKEAGVNFYKQIDDFLLKVVG